MKGLDLVFEIFEGVMLVDKVRSSEIRKSLTIDSLLLRIESH